MYGTLATGGLPGGGPGGTPDILVFSCGTMVGDEMESKFGSAGMFLCQRLFRDRLVFASLHSSLPNRQKILATTMRNSSFMTLFFFSSRVSKDSRKEKTEKEKQSVLYY